MEDETILYFFSANSDNCTDLQQRYFTAEHKDYIHPICVDNPKIKNIITKSPEIKIKYVPCFIRIFGNENKKELAKYEADDAFEWIAHFNQKHHVGPLFQQTQTRVQPPPVRVHAHQAPILTTSRDFDQSTGLNHRPARGTGYEEKRELKYEDDESDDEIPEVDIPMLKSILKESNKPPAGKSVTIGKGKNIKIIQDITEDFENESECEEEDDPSGMSIPRGSVFDKGVNGNAPMMPSAKKKKADGLKKQAEDMANQRKLFDSQFENGQNAVRPRPGP